MSDISTFWNVSNGFGDYQLNGVDLTDGGDLQTAVLISLFTDRVASVTDPIPDASGDPRGWWGDMGADLPIGSRLWLLSRSKQTQATLSSAYDYAKEALQWLIDDGVVAKFDIYCEWSRPSLLGMRIVAHRTDGTQAAMSFDWAWQQSSTIAGLPVPSMGDFTVAGNGFLTDASADVVQAYDPVSGQVVTVDAYAPGTVSGVNGGVNVDTGIWLDAQILSIDGYPIKFQ